MTPITPNLGDDETAARTRPRDADEDSDRDTKHKRSSSDFTTIGEARQALAKHSASLSAASERAKQARAAAEKMIAAAQNHVEEEAASHWQDLERVVEAAEQQQAAAEARVMVAKQMSAKAKERLEALQQSCEAALKAELGSLEEPEPLRYSNLTIVANLEQAAEEAESFGRDVAVRAAAVGHSSEAIEQLESRRREAKEAEGAREEAEARANAAFRDQQAKAAHTEAAAAAATARTAAISREVAALKAAGGSLRQDIDTLKAARAAAESAADAEMASSTEELLRYVAILMMKSIPYQDPHAPSSKRAADKLFATTVDIPELAGEYDLIEGGLEGRPAYKHRSSQSMIFLFWSPRDGGTWVFAPTLGDTDAARARSLQDAWTALPDELMASSWVKGGWTADATRMRICIVRG
eukprot:gnl/TRDRNA2_/TRDRNA2_128575_c0_seq1.p1 gnl/TRDRNA2_/TRDRNA2_128575_c0~~gnl/TRDRNA2_/TRDRNA2_128575_c0_seq1.p1  ORF type:complete len:467 (+),score=113.67 gnl/TRDRNA2_/TRDRNA2_128575_c0_seq1:168-1403(+)